MAKLIAFSGGCHSGKTTVLGLVASKLKSIGMDVVVLDELIREHISFNEDYTDIDNIRTHYASYFKLQREIIKKKMEQETEAIVDRSNAIYLADRALTDSLFYLQNYTCPWRFNKHMREMFYKLRADVAEHLAKAFCRYSYVFEFKPIEVNERDTDIDLYRPNGTLTPELMNAANQYEYENIRMLNHYYNLTDNVVEVGPLDENSCNMILDKIIS